MSRENNDMAYIAEITAVVPIDGADAIELATVNGGWNVVVKKGEYSPGDLCVYCELDAWIPTELAPFLSKGKEPREYNGVKGERLKTAKLRGALSQGLVLPVNTSVGGYTFIHSTSGEHVAAREGMKVGDLLGIQKWEAPEVFQGANVAGNFPGFMQRTDQERIQNIARAIFTDENINSTEYEVDLKLDGSSTQTMMTADDEFIVCSRNLKLKVDMPGTFVDTVKKYFGEAGEKLIPYRGLAFQMELMGPKMQDNREKFTDFRLYVYNIMDIATGRMLPAARRHAICQAVGVPEAPVVARGTLAQLDIVSLDQMLKFAVGPSLVNPVREGLVFKAVDGSSSFKAISNEYLLEKGRK